jgi:Ca2+-binding EF-hand superfamily protein
MSLKADFNLVDAFKHFDKHGNGFIDSAQLRVGLHELGIRTTMEDTQMIVDRYDFDEKKKLFFANFIFAFTPK